MQFECKTIGYNCLAFFMGYSAADRSGKKVLEKHFDRQGRPSFMWSYIGSRVVEVRQGWLTNRSQCGDNPKTDPKP